MADSFDYFIHSQASRQTFIKILILDKNLSPIEEITGSATTGTYNITNGSAVRRSCNLSLVLDKEKLLPVAGSPFWLNRKFKVYIGVKNFLRDDIVWFNQGVYVIKSPAVNIKVDGKTLSVSGLDLAAMLTGDVSGILTTDNKILAGTPLHEAVYSVITQLGGETRVAVESTPYAVPYDIEASAGAAVWDIINTLLELYKNFEAFYDEDGYFVFRKTSALINDQIEWDFEKYDLVNALTKTINYNNVRNEICVRGKLLDKGVDIGLQPTYIIRVRKETDEDRQDKAECHRLMEIVNFPDSNFSQDRLQEPKLRSFFIQEDTYYTLEQCRLRAEYEYENHNNFAVKLALTVVPIYCIKVNQLIRIYDKSNDISGVFVVDDISGNLSFDGLMTLNCSQIYEP